MKPFAMRILAVALWFLGGYVSGGPVGTMSMVSAALFGGAMLIELNQSRRDDRERQRRAKHLALSSCHVCGSDHRVGAEGRL